MKDQPDYYETWKSLRDERAVLADQRTTLENDLNEIQTKLSHLEQILSHLEPLAGISGSESIVGLGITDAIRIMMKSSSERMSAPDVRNALHAKGYDLSPLSAPMSSIYKVLGRLFDSGEVVREKDDDGRVFYRWKESSEITDDDIPF